MVTMFVGMLVRMIVVVGVPVAMIVVVRMSAGFTRLKNPGNAFKVDGLSFQHLLYRQVILNQYPFVRESGFEMEVPDHPAQPGGFFTFPYGDEKAGLGTLLDDVSSLSLNPYAVSVI